MDWTVVRHTGDIAYLERGLEQTQVDRPKPMSQSEFRELFPSDSSVDDATIATIKYGLS